MCQKMVLEKSCSSAIYMKKKLAKSFFCFVFFFWKTGHGQFINILEEEVMKNVVEFLPLDYCY